MTYRSCWRPKVISFCVRSGEELNARSYRRSHLSDGTFEFFALMCSQEQGTGERDVQFPLGGCDLAAFLSADGMEREYVGFGEGQRVLD